MGRAQLAEPDHTRAGSGDLIASIALTSHQRGRRPGLGTLFIRTSLSTHCPSFSNCGTHKLAKKISTTYLQLIVSSYTAHGTGPGEPVEGFDFSGEPVEGFDVCEGQKVQ